MTFLWRPYPLRSFGGRVTFERGDMLDVLRGYDDDTFDSCVCDPPYHLTSITKRFGGASNMSHAEDKDLSKVNAGSFRRLARGFKGKTWDGGDVAFRVETWAEVLRVLKPGAYVVAFSSTRTYHRMACAIEDAGFITHPMFGWIFGSGFPKATRVEDPAWDGWRYGTQSTKPALEPVYIGQKPFSEKTGTANVQRWGCGAMNIDACRVGSEVRPIQRGIGTKVSENGSMSGGNYAREVVGEIEGRWPANLIHDCSDEVVLAFPPQAGAVAPASGPSLRSVNQSVARGKFNGLPKDQKPSFHDDSGSAARFFYAAKASSHERAGSKHATVKPLSLMRYLTRLVTRPGGLVLDPFAGSGTTGEAVVLEGMRAHLIDMEHDTPGDLARREARCRGFEADDPTEGAGYSTPGKT